MNRPFLGSKATGKASRSMGVLVMIFLWSSGTVFALSAEQEITRSPRSLYVHLRKIAKDHSLVLQKESAEAKIIHLDQNLISSQRWPQLELSGAVSKSFPDNRKNRLISAQVNYQIYDFGRLQAQEKAITLERDLKLLKKDLHLEDFSWQAMGKILNLQSAYRLRQIQKAILEASESKQKILSDNVKKGLRPIYDLKLSELERYNHRLSLAKVESELDLAIADFSNFLRQWFPPSWADGIDKQTQKSLGQDPSQPSPSKAALDLSKETFLDHADPRFWLELVRSWKKEENGIQEKIRDASRTMTQSKTDILKADQMPEVFLNLEANYGGSWEEQKREYLGQIGLRWSVPWKGKTHWEQEKIREKLKLVDIDYAFVKEKELNDLETGIKELGNLVQIGEAQNSLYQARREMQRLIEERQNLGKASAFEVAQATLELSNILLEKIKTAHRSQEIALKIAQSLRLKNPEIILNPQWSSVP